MTSPFGVRIAVALVFGSMLAACGGSDGAGGGADAGSNDAMAPIDSAVPTDGGADANQASDGNVPNDGAPGDGGACAPAKVYGGGETTMTGVSVTAKIVDETGAPVVGQPAYLCGLNICEAPAMTQADGTVTIHSTLMMKKPAFKVGDTISYSEIAIPLTGATTDFTNGGTTVLTIAKLAGKPGATLTPGPDAVSGDVTISVPTGANVGIDGLVYDTPDKQKLRTQRIPLANDAPVLASAGVSGFGLLYGLAPAETIVCAPVKVTVALPHATMTPNDLGWAPGAAVEFWVMTTDSFQQYAPYAGWAKISDGVVSPDGASIATVNGQGFPFLETFAVRKP